MSLTILDNQDGTFTVSCGNETKTIGIRQKYTPPTGMTMTVPVVVSGRYQLPSRFPKIIPKNTGGAALDDAGIDSPFTTIHLHAKSMEDFSNAFDSDVVPLANDETPLMMSILWEGSGEPDTDLISQMLGRHSSIACQIHTPLKKILG